jgi:hypothetical protein
MQPISGDAFYYAGQSRQHDLAILKALDFKSDAPVKNLIYFTGISLLGFLLFAQYCIGKIKFNFITKSILVLTFLFIIRFITINSGILASHHPPLQLLPLFISTSILGFSDFTLRLPQVIGLAGLNAWLYLFLVRKINCLSAILVSTALCTMPLVLHVATLVESSIWNFIAGTICLVVILSNKKISNHQFFVVMTIASLAALLRAPAFLISVFLCAFLISLNYRNLQSNYKKILIIILPISIYLPFILRSLIFGTTARYVPGESIEIPNEHSTIFRIIYAIEEGVILNTLTYSISFLMLCLIAGNFLKLQNSQHYFLRNLFFLLYFVFGIFLFFTIRPVLWGTDRYKIEYVFQFIVSGGVLIAIFLVSRGLKGIVVAIFGYILCFNIYSFYLPLPPQPEKFSKYQSVFKFQTEKVYDYRTALEVAKEKGLASNTLYISDTYGIFPQVLAGYNLDEIYAANRLMQLPIYESGSSAINPQLVNRFPEIQLVLLDDHHANIIQEFLELGWAEWRIFPNSSGKNLIFGIIRR